MRRGYRLSLTEQAVFAPPTAGKSLAIGAQSTEPEGPKRVEALLKEIQAQEIVIADNQAKIEVKLGTLGEAIRVARIYAGRDHQ